MTLGGRPVVNHLLTPHEQRTASRYARDYRGLVTYKQSRGEKPYFTWGVWDAETRTYDEALENLIRRIVVRGQISEGMRVLDVGCGTGASSIDIHKLTGASVTGIDIVPEALEYGEKQVANQGLSDAVKLQRMSATQLAFEDQTFDVITAIDCCCHFDTREDFLRQAARVLRPGGRLVLLDIVEVDDAKGFGRTVLRRLLMKQWNIHANNRYGATELTRRIVGAGFAEVQTEFVGSQMLVPATRFLRKPEIRNEYRKEFGRVGEYLLHLSLSATELGFRSKLADFVFVTAIRSGALHPTA